MSNSPVRLVTYRAAQTSSSIGLIHGDRIIDVPTLGRQIGQPLPDDMVILMAREDYFELANRLWQACSDAPAESSVPLSEARLLSPVPEPASIRDAPCFLEHVRKGMAAIGSSADGIGELPGYYKGNPRTVIGHQGVVEIPRYADTVDFEMEVGVFIRRQGKNIDSKEADDYIGGYTIFNDASARARQSSEMRLNLGPAKGKDFDTGNVIGPCLVPVIDMDESTYDVRVNGVSWTSGTLSGMHWTFAELISYISDSETLYPGDFIAAGTVPEGCGLELGRFPEPGDTIELEVSSIGTLAFSLSHMAGRD